MAITHTSRTNSALYDISATQWNALVDMFSGVGRIIVSDTEPSPAYEGDLWIQAGGSYIPPSGEYDWAFPVDNDTLGAWAMTAGTGTAIMDLTTHAHPGTATGFTWEASGPAGECVVLDGSGGIDFGTSAAFDPYASSFTAEILVKITAGYPDYNAIVSRSNGSDQGWMLHLQAGANKGTPCFSTGVSNFAAPTTAAPLGTAAWRYIAVTKAVGENPLMYVDGTAQTLSYTAATVLNQYTGGPLKIGASAGSNPGMMRVAGARISSVVRTPTEIAAVWTSLAGLV
jgi:hypothetical protein